MSLLLALLLDIFVEEIVNELIKRDREPGVGSWQKLNFSCRWLARGTKGSSKLWASLDILSSKTFPPCILELWFLREKLLTKYITVKNTTPFYTWDAAQGICERD